MPETDSYLRADVFTLLIDTDFRLHPDTGTFCHFDGRPFTNEEQATVLLANRDELEATLEVRLLIDTEVQKKVGIAGLNIVLAPYDDQHDEDFTLGDVISHVSHEGPSDIERLAYVMNGFVPDRQ
ncbi:hypothetical protein ACWFR1_04170 [Streptomyces sp. NPDC055103]